MALPLGELSPQVTERVLQPISNANVICRPLRPRFARTPLPKGEASLLFLYSLLLFAPQAFRGEGRFFQKNKE